MTSRAPGVRVITSPMSTSGFPARRVVITCRPGKFGRKKLAVLVVVLPGHDDVDREIAQERRVGTALQSPLRRVARIIGENDGFRLLDSAGRNQNRLVARANDPLDLGADVFARELVARAALADHAP